MHQLLKHHWVSATQQKKYSPHFPRVTHSSNHAPESDVSDNLPPGAVRRTLCLGVEPLPWPERNGFCPSSTPKNAHACKLHWSQRLFYPSVWLFFGVVDRLIVSKMFVSDRDAFVTNFLNGFVKKRADYSAAAHREVSWHVTQKNQSVSTVLHAVTACACEPEHLLGYPGDSNSRSDKGTLYYRHFHARFPRSDRQLRANSLLTTCAVQFSGRFWTSDLSFKISSLSFPLKRPFSLGARFGRCVIESGENFTIRKNPTTHSDQLSH